MNIARAAIASLLRGPGASRLLRAAGIDPKRYWLLMDLFGQLSERREYMGQLGRDYAALKMISYIYFAMMGVAAVLMAAVRMPPFQYLWLFQVLTGFILFTVLLPEASNSLVNPMEALALAQHPINGATYTAAKASHLATVILYIATGLNAVAAVAGLTLEGSPWWYPLAHMAAAFSVGAVLALCICAGFGWLIRFVPPRRLKSMAQMAEVLPWIAFMVGAKGIQLAARQVARWWPAAAAHAVSLAVGFSVIAAVGVLFGLRSLSGDYLIRVSSMVQGGGSKKRPRGRSRLSDMVARFAGGPPARAAFEYLSRMMLRDWQFRRAFIPMIYFVAAPAVTFARTWRTTPFSGNFTWMHVLPHVFGFVLLTICMQLPFGTDYKGSWMFLLAPGNVFSRFARGVHAMLWVRLIAIPHLIVFCIFAGAWGVWQSAVFTSYSLAVSSLYLGLEIRLINAVPFSTQFGPSRNAMMLPLMLGGGIVIAIMVAVQHFLIFRSALVALVATAVFGAAAVFVTRNSLTAFENTMRYSLGLISTETGVLYKEVDV